MKVIDYSFERKLTWEIYKPPVKLSHSRSTLLIKSYLEKPMAIGVDVATQTCGLSIREPWKSTNEFINGLFSIDLKIRLFIVFIMFIYLAFK